MLKFFGSPNKGGLGGIFLNVRLIVKSPYGGNSLYIDFVDIRTMRCSTVF